MSCVHRVTRARSDVVLDMVERSGRAPADYTRCPDGPLARLRPDIEYDFTALLLLDRFDLYRPSPAFRDELER
jgi:hypothetical protein